MVEVPLLLPRAANFAKTSMNLSFGSNNGLKSFLPMLKDATAIEQLNAAPKPIVAAASIALPI